MSKETIPGETAYAVLVTYNGSNKSFYRHHGSYMQEAKDDMEFLLPLAEVDSAEVVEFVPKSTVKVETAVKPITGYIRLLWC